MGAMMGQGGAPNLQDMMKGAGQEKDKGRSRDKGKSKSAESDETIDVNKMLEGLLGR